MANFAALDRVCVVRDREQQFVEHPLAGRSFRDIEASRAEQPALELALLLAVFVAHRLLR